MRPNQSLVEDPRPDLATDHDLWQIVLELARETSDQVYGVLHGLRCGGTTLFWRQDGKLHLDYQSVLDFMDKDTLLSQWLRPLTAEITQVIRTAEQMVRSDVRELWNLI